MPIPGEDRPLGHNLYTALRQANLRATRQRLHIADLLFGAGNRHVTAEGLYREAKLAKHSPSLATVYNALHQFADAGLIQKIAVFGNTTWYDTRVGPHLHFYVEDRDELLDIPDECLPSLNLPTPPGMRITGIDVVVRLQSNGNAALRTLPPASHVATEVVGRIRTVR